MSVAIRHQFIDDNKAHTVYDFDLGLPSGPIASSETLTFDDGPATFVEVFEWASPNAALRAAEVPEVITIWEPMASLCEERNGLPGLEFPAFERLHPDETGLPG